MMNNLKPCPFCGSKAHDAGSMVTSIDISSVRCSNSDCLASFKSVDAEVWNRRSTPAAFADVQSLLATKPAGVPEGFADRLSREMPAGTVIADPAWWAPRILRAIGAAPAAPTAAPADHADKLERIIMEKRIELVPEYEGGWRANVYRDSDEPQATAAGTTPSAAVKAALKSAAPEGAEGAQS